MGRIIKIGTRGSQLALWQAHWVKAEIEKILKHDVTIEIVKIKTTGDQITDRPLAMVGGKGLFVKEIEQQLIDRQIDIAVHSMKDMPADLPAGLTIGAIPVRENPFDVLISRNNITLTNLPAGAKVGTSSLRRASQIRHARPDIMPVSIRGNLDTRLKKLETGEYDAVILAAAGIIRLGMEDKITQYLDETIMLPAAGQGALCIESRKIDPKCLYSNLSNAIDKHIDIDSYQNSAKETKAADSNFGNDLQINHDIWISEILQQLDDIETHIPVKAERAFLKKMEGSCHIPAACFGKFQNKNIKSANRLDIGLAIGLDKRLILTGLVASEDGKEVIKESLTCEADLSNIDAVGMELADIILKKGGKRILGGFKKTDEY